jgi:hypothetical protein
MKDIIFQSAADTYIRILILKVVKWENITIEFLRYYALMRIIGLPK